MENVAKLENMTIDDVISEWHRVDYEMKTLKRKKEELELDLKNYYQVEIAHQLSESDYGCGTAHMESKNWEVTCNIPKKIDWDQGVLSKKTAEIVHAGENPADYLKIKYDISENAYKNWPEKTQKYFCEARTVTPGNPKFTFVSKG